MRSYDITLEMLVWLDRLATLVTSINSPASASDAGAASRVVGLAGEAVAFANVARELGSCVLRD